MAEFAYNASALGAGGVIKRGDITTVIPSLASVALAPTGGRGTSVANYTSPELSFTYAQTEVSGEETAGQFTTFTRVVIQGLTLFGRLTVAEMGGVVISTRGLQSHDDHPFQQTQIWYSGVALDGHPITPVYDTRVQSCLRYADFKQLVQGSQYSDELLAPLEAENDALMTEQEKLDAKAELITRLDNGQAVQGSMVKSLTCSGPVVPGKGHVLPIPGIGVARFGEMMFKPGRRRLNLLRLKLDANLGWVFPPPPETRFALQPLSSSSNELPQKDGGSITIASMEGNGSLLVP